MKMTGKGLKVRTPEIYRELANKMLWSLLTFLSFLAYFVEARPFFRVAFGEYSVGLLDGILATLLSLAAILYWKAKEGK